MFDLSRAFAPLAVATLGACFSMTPMASSPAMQPASPQQIQAQQREATARALGYPTRKSPQDLAQTIAQQTHKFTRTSHHAEGQLEAPTPFTFQAVHDTCYTIVLRLGDGAAWGDGAYAGLRFDFRGASGNGSGGPGVVGPGAVVSVGCAETDGEIALGMTPMVGHDPIGHGPFSIELWSHKLTHAEKEHLIADRERQIEEQREFAAREAAKKQQRASTGCAKCEARYQGCIGAGRTDCREQYGDCAFEEVGADYLSACPSP